MVMSAIEMPINKQKHRAKPDICNRVWEKNLKNKPKQNKKTNKEKKTACSFLHSPSY